MSKSGGNNGWVLFQKDVKRLLEKYPLILRVLERVDSINERERDRELIQLRMEFPEAFRALSALLGMSSDDLAGTLEDGQFTKKEMERVVGIAESFGHLEQIFTKSIRELRGIVNHWTNIDSNTFFDIERGWVMLDFRLYSDGHIVFHSRDRALHFLKLAAVLTLLASGAISSCIERGVWPDQKELAEWCKISTNIKETISALYEMVSKGKGIPKEPTKARRGKRKVESDTKLLR